MNEIDKLLGPFGEMWPGEARLTPERRPSAPETHHPDHTSHEERNTTIDTIIDKVTPSPTEAGEHYAEGKLSRVEVVTTQVAFDSYEITSILGDIEVALTDAPNTRLIRTVEITQGEQEAREILARLGAFAPGIVGASLVWNEPPLNMPTQNANGSTTIHGFQMGGIRAGSVTIHQGGRVGNVNTGVIKNGVPQGESAMLAPVRVKYHMEIPRQQLNILTLNTTTGNLYISGHYGEMSLETISGGIKIENSLSNINARTTSGDVSIRESSRGVFVKSITGNVALDRHSGQIKVYTTSGDVNVSGVVQADNTIHTVTGNVKLRCQDGIKLLTRTESGKEEINIVTNPNSPRTLDISTISGNISVRRR